MTCKNVRSVRGLTLWALGIAIVTLAAPTLCSAQEIEIEIAPATLNLQSHGKVVTVHTTIPFNDIEGETVIIALRTVLEKFVVIDSWKADDRGYFVAKFLIDDIKGLDLHINDYNTLKFSAWTTTPGEGEPPVWGFADVMVIDCGASYREGGPRRRPHGE